MDLNDGILDFERRSPVRSPFFVPKMTIHVTNMFRICADTVRVI